MSRVTQGVRLINLKNNQIVSSVAVIDKIDESETGQEEIQIEDNKTAD